MKGALFGLSLLLFFTAGPAVDAAFADRSPSGSFLDYSPATVDALVSQIDQSPAIRERYGRHYGITPEQVAGRLVELKLVSLQDSLKTTYSYIGADDSVRSTTKILRKGTMVFASREGIPVLEAATGNPIGPLPASGQQSSQPQWSAKDSVPQLALAPPVAITSDPSIAVSTRYLGGIAVVLGGLALTGGGHGESQQAPIAPVSAVPEPSALAALAVGSIALAGAVLRRRR